MNLTDAQIHAGLRGFAQAAASLLDRVATSPDLVASPSPADKGLVGRARQRLTGSRGPGAPGWDLLPPAERGNWWVDRVGILLSLAGAAPDLLGPAADAVPVAAVLRVASRGLVICAVAREHAVTDPSVQGQLLGRVLLGRDIAPAEASAPAATIALDPAPGLSGIVRSAVRIGRELLALRSDLAAGLEIADSSPRRGFGARIPAVGAVRSFTEQWGTLRADADEVVRLVSGPTSRSG